MATFNKFNCFTLDLASKKHDLSSDTIKVLLTNTAPVATNAVLTDITEIAAGNGYATGGNQATVASLAQASGVTKLVLNNPTAWQAVGAVGPFRYAVVYNSTSTAKNLIGWADYGSSMTLGSGDQFQVQFDATNGAITVS